jgi:hypothetical protein
MQGRSPPTKPPQIELHKMMRKLGDVDFGANPIQLHHGTGDWLKMCLFDLISDPVQGDPVLSH